MSVRSDEAGVVPPVAPAVLRDERPGLDATTTRSLPLAIGGIDSAPLPKLVAIVSEPVTAAVKVG